MDPDTVLDHWARLSEKNTKDFLRAVQQDVIASAAIHDPPFGKKKSTYVDWFASGKPLKTFETIMQQSVLPYYANTHTYSTSTARYTSTSVANSRRIVSRCLNAQTTKGHPHEAVVLFCGDGSTAAIAKVRNVFRLGDPGFWFRKAHSEHAVCSGDLSSTFSISDTTSPSSAPDSSLCQRVYERLPAQYRPVVFVSIQEHHSNLLPWRESCADVVVIGEHSRHRLDLDQLEMQLQKYRERPLKIGSFSGGSNLTGVLNDTVAIAELLHKYDAFAFFDYAGVGAYTTVDMNPPPSNSSLPMHESKAYKDGVFLSPHKMVGGPGSSGVLVARLEIFSWAEQNSSTNRNEILPSHPAGGTVDLVFDNKHKYVKDVVAREEPGTPNILATIRTGLVMRLQEIMGPKLILEKEYRLATYIYHRLLQNNNIEILGTQVLSRVAVFSAMISIPVLSTPERPMEIHYSLLSAIMNDFFGIEMRGGCMCAGPYGAKLLKLTPEKKATLWELMVGADNGNDDDYQTTYDNCGRRIKKNLHQQDLASSAFKPGFVRFSFPYFARDKDVEFVLQSFEWVAQYGFLLIPLYRLDGESGMWSIREAVRRAVNLEISPRRFASGLRSDYIPVATDCIYGLQKLFSHQARISAPAGVPTKASDASRPFTPEGQSSSWLNSRMINTPNQAGESSLRLSSMGKSAAHLRTSSNTHGPTSMVVQDSSCTAKTPTHPISRSSSVASLSGGHDPHQQVYETIHGYQSPYNTSHHPTEVGSQGHLSVNGLVQEPSSGRSSPSIFSFNRPRLFTHGTSSSFGSAGKMGAVHPTSDAATANQMKISPAMSAALKELSIEALEEEMSKVDCNPLAASIRQFAIPIEIAQVYMGQNTGGSVPTCFPKRRR